MAMSPDEITQLVAKVVDQVLYRNPAEMPIPYDEADLRPFDYARMAATLAACDAGRFMEENFRSARNLINREDLLRHACRAVGNTGDILEFGVMGGQSLRLLCAELPGRLVHGFDSFTGIPEDWKYDTPAGSFSNSGVAPGDLPENAAIHVGDFADTIMTYRNESDRTVALLHIDCDIYTSARTTLFGLADRITAGTIIVFDEFLNYPGWRQHEYRAFMEFVDKFGVPYEYLYFASSYQSVAVRITGPALLASMFRDLDVPG